MHRSERGALASPFFCVYKRTSKTWRGVTTRPSAAPEPDDLSQSAVTTRRPFTNGSLSALASNSFRIRPASRGLAHFTSPSSTVSPDSLSATRSISKGLRSSPAPHHRLAGPQVSPSPSRNGTLARASSSQISPHEAKLKAQKWVGSPASIQHAERALGTLDEVLEAVGFFLAIEER